MPESRRELDFTVNFNARNTSVQEKMHFVRAKFGWKVSIEITPQDRKTTLKTIDLKEELLADVT